jgi:hypothetical protein
MTPADASGVIAIMANNLLASNRSISQSPSEAVGENFKVTPTERKYAVLLFARL